MPHATVLPYFSVECFELVFCTQMMFLNSHSFLKYTSVSLLVLYAAQPWRFGYEHKRASRSKGSDMNSEVTFLIPVTAVSQFWLVASCWPWPLPLFLHSESACFTFTVECLVGRSVAGPQKLQHRGRTNLLAQAIQALSEKSGNAVLLNSQPGEFFETTVGVHQGCLLPTILFNLFLQNVMQETPHDHHTSKYFHWWKAIDISTCDSPATFIL